MGRFSEMETVHEKILDKNLITIVRNVEVNQCIYSVLIAKGILTETEVSILSAVPRNDERTYQLILLLKRKTGGFWAFLLALNHGRQTGALEVVLQCLLTEYTNQHALVPFRISGICESVMRGLMISLVMLLAISVCTGSFSILACLEAKDDSISSLRDSIEYFRREKEIAVDALKLCEKQFTQLNTTFNEQTSSLESIRQKFANIQAKVSDFGKFKALYSECASQKADIMLELNSMESRVKSCQEKEDAYIDTVRTYEKGWRIRDDIERELTQIYDNQLKEHNEYKREHAICKQKCVYETQLHECQQKLSLMKSKIQLGNTRLQDLTKCQSDLTSCSINASNCWIMVTQEEQKTDRCHHELKETEILKVKMSNIQKELNECKMLIDLRQTAIMNENSPVFRAMQRLRCFFGETLVT